MLEASRIVMEDFSTKNLSSKYRSVFVQKGGGMEMDRYIYGMKGEGLGNFLGSLMRKAIPLIGQTIKRVASTAKPVIETAGKELVTAGAKRGVQELNKVINKNSPVTHKPHKKRRRTKWRNL